MNECACVYVGDYDPPLEYNETEETATEETGPCSECGRKIEAGETFLYTNGLWPEGRYEYRTCTDCVSIRHAFFCDGFCHANMFQDLREHFDEDGLDTLSVCCFAELTPRAGKNVATIVDRCMFGGEDEEENNQEE